jgi:flagellar protein FlaF
MYKFSYDEVLGDGGERQRADERLAIQHSIDLLLKAEETGPNSREAVDALFYVNRLWSYLLEELAHPQNALPVEARASLISVGIWLLREAEAISGGTSENLKGVREVSQTIAEALQ